MRDAPDITLSAEKGSLPPDFSQEHTSEQPRFPKDLQFAQKLIADDSTAWDDLLRSLRKKVGPYIEYHYTRQFSDDDKQDILSDLMLRLLSNDKKVLSTFRGMQTLSAHIESQLKWAIQTVQRQHAIKYLASSEDPEENEIEPGTNSRESIPIGNADPEIPRAIMQLPDKQRWVFLLRYYEDFGFPDSETVLLAKELKKTPKEVSNLINELLEPTGKDALSAKKKKLAALSKSIENLQAKLYFLSLTEHKLQQNNDQGMPGAIDPMMIEQELAEIQSKKRKAKDRLKRALLERERFFVGTSYKVIGIILNEPNQNTLRSRLKTAQDTLMRVLERTQKERNTKTLRQIYG